MIENCCAELDDNNVVLRVIVCDDPQWAIDNLGGNWVQTFTNMEGHNYAGVGYSLIEPAPVMGKNGRIAVPARIMSETGVPNYNFATPQPFPSWTLDDSANWQPPIPMPDDGYGYNWDEENQMWVQI
jgi:hypothetical protein